jgi:hypothetical protein
MRVNQTARQCGHALLVSSWHIHPDAWATVHLNCTHCVIAPARNPTTGIGRCCARDKRQRSRAAE